MIRVGVAVVEVAVPVGTPMAGYAARPGPSVGTHDPLTVRALVVDGVGLVSVDCCALDERTCAVIRTSSGLREVFVAATHTHSGPSLTPGRVGGADEAVLASVIDAAAKALDAASRAAVPCGVRYGETTGAGVARNRRHLDRPIDPPLQVVSFDGDAGPVAVLVTYPCHPVVLDASNRLVSADYPGVLRAAVEAAYPTAVCVFMTGCAGDVNDGHAAEASYTAVASPRRTFDDVARVGRLLGEAAVGALSAASDVDTTSGLRVATVPVTLALQPLRRADVIADRDLWCSRTGSVPASERAVVDVWAAWADDWLAAPERPTTWESRVGRLLLGSLSVVTLPCEPFLGVAERLGSVLGPAVVLGYTDGVVGYLPTADDYPDGGYEVVDAHRYYGMPGPFRRGTAEQLVDAVVNLRPG